MVSRLFLVVSLAWAQSKDPWFGLRAGLNWGQYVTKDRQDIRSLAYWGGGFSGALGVHQAIDQKGFWALQGELGLTQRRGTDRNLLSDYRFNLWSLDLTALGVWRWMRKFEGLFIQTGPMSSVLLYGKYWERDNLSSEIETRKVAFGRGDTRDIRRGEISWVIGMGTGYLVGPGYLTFDLRFWHGLNNLSSGAFKRWKSYGVLMNLIYWYDDSLRE